MQWTAGFNKNAPMLARLSLACVLPSQIGVRVTAARRWGGAVSKTSLIFAESTH
jgi:hypothetical protein